MMKKYLAVLTLILLALNTVMAYAEEAQTFPTDIADSSTANAELKPYEQYFPRRLMTPDTLVITGDPVTDTWAVSVTEPSEVIKAEVSMMSEHVMQEPIATFFDEMVQAQIETRKPSDLEDIRDLVTYELAPVASTEYLTSYGGDSAVFEIETAFEDGTELVVLIGLPLEQPAANGDLMGWSVQKTVCNEQQIRVAFTEEELLRMGTEPALMVVLGVPEELDADKNEQDEDESIEDTPSRTYDDMTEIETSDAYGDDWRLFVTEPSELIELEVAAMVEHVAEEPIVTFFDEAVQAEIIKHLPESVADAAELIAYELVPVECDGYQPEYNNVAADMTFASLFVEETELVVMIGLPKESTEDGNLPTWTAESEEDDDLLTWTVQQSAIQEGKVRVMFTEEELVQMETIPALLVVMSAPVIQ